ncbi:hypothetical protein [Novosphingobium sp. TCA1]|uniref:hypothetical protein n=1 Tax=Novosphingobium sp. TCA1 TaxID=2682474 RepID=UPI001308262C|nr:hypothetical protein [Novosphingobium sp. TCA1]GFE73477.1 hypothetical protein NTCA1_11260 [Novosphingobium sp. TCA1]
MQVRNCFAVSMFFMLVSGCATVKDVQSKPIVAVFDSQKSVDELSSCIAGVLSKPKWAMVRTLPAEDGVTLVESSPVTGGSQVVALTEIRNAGDKRTISYRTGLHLKEAQLGALRSNYSPCF